MSYNIIGNLVVALGEWVSGCCIMPNEQCFNYIMARTGYIQWNGDDVYFVLDQQA